MHLYTILSTYSTFIGTINLLILKFYLSKLSTSNNKPSLIYIFVYIYVHLYTQTCTEILNAHVFFKIKDELYDEN